MAVKEHYQPLSAEAPIPSTPLGGVLAIADKLDTVAGLLRHRPDSHRLQGSPGPAPGRARASCASCSSGAGTSTPCACAALALEAVGRQGHQPAAETLEALEAFFRDRVAFQLEQAGYPGPVRRSALAAGWTDLVDLKARCEALAAFADDPRFASLAQSAKRIANILKDETCGGPGRRPAPGARGEGPGRRLLAHLEARADQTTLLERLAELAAPLEAFFTAVMVKCEDPALRAARLALLRGCGRPSCGWRTSASGSRRRARTCRPEGAAGRGRVGDGTVIHCYIVTMGH